MTRFTDRLRQGAPIVSDGGTGALLAAANPRLRCPEEANLLAPETVVDIHLDFIRAGAELIEANTFGANRRKLSGLRIDDQLVEIVEAGVKLAREARDVSGANVFIGGSIGPLGDIEAGSGGADAFDNFAEQAQLLDGKGIDVFMLETFFELGELLTAIEAVQSISSLPIVAQLTFDEEAETIAGVQAEEAMKELAGSGVVAVGANCGIGPQAALNAIAELGKTIGEVTLAAQPNVGLPARWAGRLVFPNATPDYFGEFAAQAVALGARIIGGCCGTTPAQIAAIREAVSERREPRLSLVTVQRESQGQGPEPEQETLLAKMLRAGEWVVSVELDPPKGANLDRMLEVAALLRQSGAVDVVDINDNPMARARLSALMASVAIERRIGLETIPHVTPRDASIMGLQSQLLGAHAEGVRNILAVTGDPPHVGDYPGSSGVYEVDAIGLTATLSRLNDGVDYSGKQIDAPTSFYTGVAVNPSAEELSTEIERFRQKVEAGARFAMTQALFDMDYLDRFLSEIGGSPIPLLVGIWPLRSFELAFRIHNEVPGITIPDPVQKQLSDAGPDAARVGLELARELLEQTRSRAAGVYIIPPFKEPEAALELLR